MNGGIARLRQIADSVNCFLAGGIDVDDLEIAPQRSMRPLFGSRQAQHPLQKLLQAFQVFERLLNTAAVFVFGARPLHQRLQRGLHHRDRSLQFVGRVPQELPLLLEGMLQAFEHLFHRLRHRTQLFDLRNFFRQAQLPVLRRDARCLLRKVLQRTQTSANATQCQQNCCCEEQHSRQGNECPCPTNLHPQPDRRRGIKNGQSLRAERLAFFPIEDRDLRNSQSVIGHSVPLEIPVMVGRRRNFQPLRPVVGTGNQARSVRPHSE